MTDHQLLESILRQLDDIHSELAEIRKEARETREIAVAHRTGVKILVWIGATAIAIAAAMKGIAFNGK